MLDSLLLTFIYILAIGLDAQVHSPKKKPGRPRKNLGTPSCATTTTNDRYDSLTAVGSGCANVTNVNFASSSTTQFGRTRRATAKIIEALEMQWESQQVKNLASVRKSLKVCFSSH